jgi:cytoskeletal protein CcmA (bactofilin family)
MGIFGAKTSGTKAAAPPKAAAVAGGLSVIAAGMTVRGDIESNGIVKVEGTVDGHVVAREQVLVAKGGVVHGDIESRETVVGGMVHGSILATGRVEVQAGATVLGDITTKRIAVAEGATLNGQIRMGEHAAAASPAPALLEVKVSTAARGEPRSPTPSHPRSSVPVARVAVPPRATPQGPGQ